MKVNSHIKHECRFCTRQTNHIVKAVEVTKESDNDVQFYSAEEYAIVQCLGCEAYALRKEYSDSETYDYDDDGHPVSAVIIDAYPPALKNHKELRATWLLPGNIRVMYKESLTAFALDCKVLAGVGCRAIIEAVCLDKKIPGRDLEAKINGLLKKALITKNECDRLHSIRFIGNDSVHEMKASQEEQLRIVFNMIEHLLSNLYLIDAEAESKLEGIINDYKDFKKHLIKISSNFSAGEEHYLAKIFGKDFRRIKDNSVAFELELIKDIAAGNFKKLALGAVKPKSADPKAATVQYFIIS